MLITNTKAPHKARGLFSQERGLSGDVNVEEGEKLRTRLKRNFVGGGTGGVRVAFRILRRVDVCVCVCQGWGFQAG